MKNNNEGSILETVNVYCEQSLDPETFSKWEDVKALLIKNRRIVFHKSDCSVHNEPNSRNGLCDCLNKEEQ